MIVRFASLDLPGQEHRPRSLAERERTVVAELGRHLDGHVSFQGLRRRLQLHPQALTRVLERMARAGLLAHDEGGYRLTEDGLLAWRDIGGSPVQRDLVTVMRLALPQFLKPETVAARLGRRWFDGLRWYGETGGPGEAVLAWLTDPGDAFVRVRLAAGTLTLEVDSAVAAHIKGAKAAQAILAALAEIYGDPFSGAAE